MAKKEMKKPLKVNAKRPKASMNKAGATDTNPKLQAIEAEIGRMYMYLDRLGAERQGVVNKINQLQQQLAKIKR